MTEAQIQTAIRLALGRNPAVVLWRNSVGKSEYWSGNKAMHVQYGLAPGSADLVGIIAPSGRFFALEVKRPGQRPSEEQQRWIELVRRMGGFAAVVCSVDEATRAVEEASK